MKSKYPFAHFLVSRAEALQVMFIEQNKPMKG